MSVMNKCVNGFAKKVGENNVVQFKSMKVHYLKEKSGVKPNTMRFIEPDDPRFQLLQNGKCHRIRIVLSDGTECFDREITDYTEWSGWAIISWRHETPSQSSSSVPIPNSIGGGQA